MIKLSAVKVNIPGGIISAGDLAEILDSAGRCDVKYIRFGNRQQLYLLTEPEKIKDIERELITADIFYELDENSFPNICSSYVCTDLFSGTRWLSEGVFKDVLNSFDFSPRLKVNITDARQSLIPTLSGNLNFIAAELNNYWHFYIRFPKTNRLYIWPSLIYADEIARLCSEVEKQIFLNEAVFAANEEADGNKLYQLVQKTLKGNWQTIETPLYIEPFNLPAYEGFHRYENRLWLGVYQRAELFSVAFLKDICDLALKLKLGQLYTTPYKSLIIKGIEARNKQLWANLLQQHQINSRHSANELNWQLEDLSDEGLELKIFLAAWFDFEDMTTAGLSFAIKTNAASGLYGTINIRKEVVRKQTSFTIAYNEDFKAHSSANIKQLTGLKKEKLPEALKLICKEFNAFRMLPVDTADNISEIKKDENIQALPTGLYQCSDCLTIFDQNAGDLAQGIQPGTEFSLIADFKCSLCEAPAACFTAL